MNRRTKRDTWYFRKPRNWISFDDRKFDRWGWNDLDDVWRPHYDCDNYNSWYNNNPNTSKCNEQFNNYEAQNYNFAPSYPNYQNQKRETYGKRNNNFPYNRHIQKFPPNSRNDNRRVFPSTSCPQNNINRTCQYGVKSFKEGNGGQFNTHKDALSDEKKDVTADKQNNLIVDEQKDIKIEKQKDITTYKPDDISDTLRDGVTELLEALHKTEYEEDTVNYFNINTKLSYLKDDTNVPKTPKANAEIVSKPRMEEKNNCKLRNVSNHDSNKDLIVNSEQNLHGSHTADNKNKITSSNVKPVIRPEVLINAKQAPVQKSVPNNKEVPRKLATDNSSRTVQANVNISVKRVKTAQTTNISKDKPSSTNLINQSTAPKKNFRSALSLKTKDVEENDDMKNKNLPQKRKNECDNGTSMIKFSKIPKEATEKAVKKDKLKQNVNLERVKTTAKTNSKNSSQLQNPPKVEDTSKITRSPHESNCPTVLNNKCAKITKRRGTLAVTQKPEEQSAHFGKIRKSRSHSVDAKEVSSFTITTSQNVKGENKASSFTQSVKIPLNTIDEPLSKGQQCSLTGAVSKHSPRTSSENLKDPRLQKINERRISSTSVKTKTEPKHTSAKVCKISPNINEEDYLILFGDKPMKINQKHIQNTQNSKSRCSRTLDIGDLQLDIFFDVNNATENIEHIELEATFPLNVQNHSLLTEKSNEKVQASITLSSIHKVAPVLLNDQCIVKQKPKANDGHKENIENQGKSNVKMVTRNQTERSGLMVNITEAIISLTQVTYLDFLKEFYNHTWACCHVNDVLVSLVKNVTDYHVTGKMMHEEVKSHKDSLNNRMVKLLSQSVCVYFKNRYIFQFNCKALIWWYFWYDNNPTTVSLPNILKLFYKVALEIKKMGERKGFLEIFCNDIESVYLQCATSSNSGVSTSVRKDLHIPAQFRPQTEWSHQYSLSQQALYNQYQHLQPLQQLHRLAQAQSFTGTMDGNGSSKKCKLTPEQNVLFHHQCEAYNRLIKNYYRIFSKRPTTTQSRIQNLGSTVGTNSFNSVSRPSEVNRLLLHNKSLFSTYMMNNALSNTNFNVSQTHASVPRQASYNPAINKVVLNNISSMAKEQLKPQTKIVSESLMPNTGSSNSNLINQVSFSSPVSNTNVTNTPSMVSAQPESQIKIASVFTLAAPCNDFGSDLQPASFNSPIDNSRNDSEKIKENCTSQSSFNFKIKLPLSQPYTQNVNTSDFTSVSNTVSENANFMEPEPLDVDEWFANKMKEVIVIDDNDDFTSIKNEVKEDLPTDEKESKNFTVDLIPRFGSVDSGFGSSPCQIEHPDVLSGERICICSKTAELMCICGKAIYCSTDCQRTDWNNHQKQCIQSREVASSS